MTRPLQGWVALLAICLGLPLLGTAIYSGIYSPPQVLPDAHAIIVLSGPGADREGTTGQTRARVQTGVALWKKMPGATLVMTGGGNRQNTRPEQSHAWKMAAAARAMGVPDTAIAIEHGAGSTLQNAWFSAALPEVDPADPVIVVTQRYHLPRAWFSFRWAGFRKVTLVAAEDPDEGVHREFLAEAVKWPFNLVRAGLGSAALAAGADDAVVLPWLR